MTKSIGSSWWPRFKGNFPSLTSSFPLAPTGLSMFLKIEGTAGIWSTLGGSGELRVNTCCWGTHTEPPDPSLQPRRSLKSLREGQPFIPRRRKDTGLLGQEEQSPFVRGEGTLSLKSGKKIPCCEGILKGG